MTFYMSQLLFLADRDTVLEVTKLRFDFLDLVRVINDSIVASVWLVL